MTTIEHGAQRRRAAPTSGHQRNYRAQALIPANNRRRSNRTSRQAPANVTVASHWRMNNQLCSASPPSNGAKAQRAVGEVLSSARLARVASRHCRLFSLVSAPEVGGNGHTASSGVERFPPRRSQRSTTGQAYAAAVGDPKHCERLLLLRGRARPWDEVEQGLVDLVGVGPDNRIRAPSMTMRRTLRIRAGSRSPVASGGKMRSWLPCMTRTGTSTRGRSPRKSSKHAATQSRAAVADVRTAT
jgi:hypothetical protein